MRTFLAFAALAGFLSAPLAHADDDRDLLNRMGGKYRGTEIAILVTTTTSTELVQARYTMPRGKGRLSGIIFNATGSATITGRIKNVKCRGNRVIYTGTATAIVANSPIALRDRTFKAIATTQGRTKERLRVRASYTATSGAMTATLFTNFNLSK